MLQVNYGYQFGEFTGFVKIKFLRMHKKFFCLTINSNFRLKFYHISRKWISHYIVEMKYGEICLALADCILGGKMCKKGK